MNRILRPVASSWILLALMIIGSMAATSRAADGAPLAGTQPLTIREPLDELMVAGIDRFALRAIKQAATERSQRWNANFTSAEAYTAGVADNRARLRTIIGAVDQRPGPVNIQVIVNAGQDTAAVAEAKGYTVIPVRWNVLDGVTGEGLLLQPRAGEPKARIVVLPDADWTPEMFVGLAPGAEGGGQLPRQLAELGCQVLVPTVISRADTYSGNPAIAMTNQPHREFVYRMAFEMGRHIIGYEVEKVQAAVDAFAALNKSHGTAVPIGVAGVGEGALLAMFSAAVDARIDAALVSGYFDNRSDVWQEPIYRNVWSQLTEFGDAEIAGLIAPRTLIVEACAVPEIEGPPAVKQGRRGGAAPGRIKIVPLESLRGEFARARIPYEKLNLPSQIALVESGPGTGPAGSEAAVDAFAEAMGVQKPAAAAQGRGEDLTLHEKQAVDAEARQKRQFAELVAFTQQLLEHSARRRDEFWSNAGRDSQKQWTDSAEFYRNYVWEEMIGKLPDPSIPLNVRTRQVLGTPKYTGYEVMLDVYPDVVAGGILLVPTGIAAGEKRPVVVCQHGLEGTPLDTITGDEPGNKAYAYYKAFSARLAEKGFVVYAPQNPYRGMDRFRTLQRKSNPMKRSLFSYIIRQHERTLEWLSTLPYVDQQRIGFYGLSYGGKTAVRVPPILKQYALSICSADYNEWIRKNVTVDASYSYMFTGEYEMVEWNMGHTANYAEMAMLMTPRPFMVERGHNDGVAPDEWVAWEYAKVRRHYDKLDLGERTEIEFFNGPHTINGQGTFRFLERHLNWPQSISRTSEKK